MVESTFRLESDRFVFVAGTDFGRVEERLKLDAKSGSSRVGW